MNNFFKVCKEHGIISFAPQVTFEDKSVVLWNKMASDAPSPLASSVEKTNGSKLSRLLIDGGTTVLRTIFDRYHPSNRLSAGLKAHFLVLDELRRRSVLRPAQWVKLFPCGGAAPDSKKFDITLLILLLTNICGLPPPRKGWFAKPSPGDKSLGANIIRLKFFRNELYGHVSSTSIDTPTFSSLWKKISGTLVALGLNQTDINLLKEEKCGADDYLNILTNWVKSEEEIKSDLAKLRRSQSTTQHSIKEVRDTQLEDHKTLQDSMSVLGEVHRSQNTTQHSIEEVRRTQLEDHKTHQNSKSVLGEVHRSQSTTQRSIEEVRRTQLEDHKTLQDSKSVLGEIHRSQNTTQRSIEGVRRTQLEDHKTLQDSKSVLGEVHRSQNTTQRSIELVCQTQLEDHEKLQENKSILVEVHRSQNKTQRSIEDARQTLLEDHKTLQDSKSVLGEVHQTQTKIQSTIEGAAKSQDERLESLQTGLQEVKLAVRELSKGRNTGSQEDECLRNLVKSEFKGDIEFHVQRFQEDTREWVFSKVEDWLDDRNSQNRVIVICGNAGMGKSVISAVVCKKMQEAGRLCGSHFIQHNNVRYRKPQLMLQSLACHICYALPEFKLALVKQLKRNTGKDLNDMGVEELFALLFKEPFSSVKDPGRNMLIVIDGLDESDYHDRNELLEVIVNHFCKLPMWIRFLVTSRPERNIAKTLRHLQPFQLEAEDEQNQNDIKRFIGKKLECIPEAENTNDIVENLVKKSEGLMLYAYFLLLYIEENPSVLKQGDEKGNLPLGISAVYHRYFKRLENELMTELGIKEDSFLNFLSALAASREPLPIDFASRLLLSSTTVMANKRKLLKAINSVSSLLPVRGDRLHIFHKSIKDWLTDECCYGVHDFIVDESEGHRLIAELCAAEFDILVQRRVAKSQSDAQFNDNTMYALQHGVRHMLEVDEVTRRDGIEDVVRKYVINQELVYAKLCVNITVATEDIVCVLNEESFNSLSGETKGSLETVLSILRKNSWSLMELPHVFMQTMVNESGSVLSSEAKKLLNEKYDEICYMELINKNQQQPVVEARFHCSSEVLCFDISPDQDYMVCECANQEIQLWSLKTGIREWRKRVSVEEKYSKGLFYRRPADVPPTYPPVSDAFEFPKRSRFETTSFYRSVAFHPDGKHILPGNLSTVYTIDGKQKELFSTSECKFSVCILLADNAKILTDCPNDSKRLVIWSLDTGKEMSRITTYEDIVCFQCSPDKNLLAVSHSMGLLRLFDLQDELTELDAIRTKSPWGFMTFSVESDALVGLSEFNGRCFRCEIITNKYSRKSLSFFSPQSIFDLKGAVRPFLEGDATGSLTSALSTVIPFGKIGLLLRLESGERALLSSPSLRHVSLINLAKIQNAEKKADTNVEDVAFSTNGENVYVVSGSPATVTVWEYSSWNKKTENRVVCHSILPVKDGVIVVKDRVEFWDFELTECKRRWNRLRGIELLPISEEEVACLTKAGTAFILSTSDGRSEFIGNEEGRKILAMNKKFQKITCKRRGKLDVQKKYVVNLSEASLSSPRKIRSFEGCPPAGLFSPKGNFVVLWTSDIVEIYNAISGELNRKLLEKGDIVAVKFITNQALIVSSREDVGNFLRMFDVISGEQLTALYIEERPNCLGVCLNSLHVAVGLYGSDVRLIQVHLPRSRRLSHQ